MVQPRRLPGGIPIPVVVIGLPLAALIGIAAATHRPAPATLAPAATAVQTADLVLQDRQDGSIAISSAADHKLIDIVQPGTNAFLRVMLSGLVRERRREDLGNTSLPFHLTRWSDGRLTLDDLATHKLIELNAFGPDNAAAFARLIEPRLIDVSHPPPAQPPAGTPDPARSSAAPPAAPASPPRPPG